MRADGRAYYNEIDPFAAQWLRNLIDAGHIAPGDVDERSIVDVGANDLAGYTQCHFFAGIGGWSLALRLAGWPDARPVWTGSCPCQPFSAAGKGKAADDERHLWPFWFPLIAERQPAIVFGEQVEAAIGWGWLDAVFSDLEAEGYACGAAILPACSVGAPHIRQRCWFVADSLRGGAEHASGESLRAKAPAIGEDRNLSRKGGGPRIDQSIGELAHTERAGIRIEAGNPDGAASSLCGEVRQQWLRADAGAGGDSLGDADEPGSQGREQRWLGANQRASGAPGVARFWSAAEWLACSDGKARPTQPGLFPLAHGISFKLGSGEPQEGWSRVGMLRAYGNAIVPQMAEQFIRAFMEVADAAKP